MTPLIWCIIILAIGLGLIFMEMFIPSAGVLSGLAAIAVLSAVILAYVNCGPFVGTIFTLVGVILVPCAIGISLRLYPQTPFGRRMLAIPPSPEEVTPVFDRTPDGQPLKGPIGKATTPLLPGGSIKIERTTYDAVSEGEPIDKGDIVVVVRVEGKHLVVRKVDGQLPEARIAAAPSDPSQPIKAKVLGAESLEALDIDPFDDPLG